MNNEMFERGMKILNEMSDENFVAALRVHKIYAIPKSQEKYWVLSDCEYPVKIRFDKETAFKSVDYDQALYIDSFDADGNRVNCYKLVDDEYTTDF